MYSHLLMALGFAVAFMMTLSIRRYGHATLFLGALIETYANARYPFHVRVRDYLAAHNGGPFEKAALQIKLLIGCAVGGAAIILLLSPWLIRLSRGRQMMLLGSLIVVAQLGVELISLHQTDAILYYPVGPFVLCVLIYFIGAMAAAGGAWMEGHRQRQGRLSA